MCTAMFVSRDLMPSAFPGVDKKMAALGALAERQPAVGQSLARGENAYATVSLDGQHYRVYLHPIRDREVSHGYILTSYALGEIENLLGILADRLSNSLRPLPLAQPFLGGLAMTRKVLQPVRQMSLAAAQLGDRELSQRLPVAGADEFSQLAGTFNGMFDRLEASFEELERSVEQQRRFVADASHELRTPLTVIHGSTSWALQKARSDANTEPR